MRSRNNDTSAPVDHHLLIFSSRTALMAYRRVMGLLLYDDDMTHLQSHLKQGSVCSATVFHDEHGTIPVFQLESEFKEINPN